MALVPAASTSKHFATISSVGPSFCEPRVCVAELTASSFQGCKLVLSNKAGVPSSARRYKNKLLQRSLGLIPCASVRSEGFWSPTSNVAREIWSIRNDLEVPQSFHTGPSAAQGGQGPPPMLQERFQSVISQLFQHRIIRCGGAVDDDMANLIVAQLLYLDAVDSTRDIIMYVNSPGGSVTAGMAIFDTMRHIRPNVSTVCVGLAASMGAFLLSGGTKGKRYSLPNSRIMIHQPLGGAQGQQTDIEIQANEILHHKANLNGYLSYHTGQPLEKIVQDTDRDFFMSAKEAKEYGLIDAVISNPLKALQPLPQPEPTAA
ncbi:hypothetical protein L7F22_008396 [Adiantum nelumboides]|nr:hypothetical protein [Adiantum nelumboides]